MVAENPVFPIRQNSLAQQAEVGDVLFLFPSEGAAAIRPCIEFQLGVRHSAAVSGAAYESVVASAKNSAKNAITGGRL
jgi:hypothetical protein